MDTPQKWWRHLWTAPYHTKIWLFAPSVKIFGSKLHIFVPNGQFEPQRSMFSTWKWCLIGSLAELLATEVDPYFDEEKNIINSVPLFLQFSWSQVWCCYLDLGFWYSICPTQPIFTNTETAMLCTQLLTRQGNDRTEVQWNEKYDITTSLLNWKTDHLMYSRLSPAASTATTRSGLQLYIEDVCRRNI